MSNGCPGNYVPMEINFASTEGTRRSGERVKFPAFPPSFCDLLLTIGRDYTFRIVLGLSSFLRNPGGERGRLGRAGRGLGVKY